MRPRIDLKPRNTRKTLVAQLAIDSAERTEILQSHFSRASIQHDVRSNADQRVTPMPLLEVHDKQLEVMVLLPHVGNSRPDNVFNPKVPRSNSSFQIRFISDVQTVTPFRLLV